MTIKIKRALTVFKGHHGEHTVRAILNQIPEHIFKKLSGKEIGELMNVIDQSYKTGKAIELKEWASLSA